LPTRIHVASSRLTIAASTFSRGSPARARSRRTRRRSFGSASPNSIIRWNFALSRSVRQSEW
jgi:hypothetical protein